MSTSRPAAVFRAALLTTALTAGLVAAPASAAGEATVEARDHAFVPADLSVPAGTTVTWTNTGEEIHTVTAGNGAFDSGYLQPGQSFSHTFDDVATVKYFCELHGNNDTWSGMVGSVTVTGGGTQQPAPTARDISDACDGSHEDGFRDVPEDNPHEAAIDCIVDGWAIASGKTATTYAPSEAVTRAQMATFIARTMEAGGYVFREDAPDRFRDDDGSPHERNIDKLAAAGVVGGTGPSTYSPEASVTRGQMATFLVKAYEATVGSALPPGPDYFTDDDGTTHEANINKAAKAGFAAGVSATEYRPAAAVRRDAMGSFIARVLDALVEAGKATPPA